MQSIDNGFAAASEVPIPSGQGTPINFSDILWMLRRGYLLPLLGCLIGLSAAAAYMVFVPELYNSTARILIDRSTSRYLQTNKIVDEPTFDDTDTGSQIYVLSSDSIVVPVVQSMNLAHDPEFVGPPRGASRFWDNYELIAIAKRILGWKRDPASESDANKERVAVEAFLKHLTVFREEIGSVIGVTFASEDPKKAANIANALADSYIAATLDAKLKSTQIASELIQNRLVELKQQVIDADRTLQEYKAANDLSGGSMGPPSTQQIAELGTRLTSAQVAVAEAKARLNNILKAASDNESDVTLPENEVIVKLRLQYLDLNGKAVELERHVGPNHVAVLKLRSQMDEVRRAMADEEQRIAGSFASDYHLAEARKDELDTTVAKFVKDADTNRATQAKMRELENSAEGLRTLYNSFLQKFNEINKNEPQIAAPVLDARIITRASPPLQRSSKKSLTVLGGSVFAGLLLGMLAAVAREWAADVFRTSDQVKRATNVYSVTLPVVEAKRRQRSWFGGKGRPGIDTFVLDTRNWRYTEAIRNIRAMIDVARRVDGDKVIGVVSSVAQEGKTTTVTNLLALMSSSSNIRVLAIDGDVHRRQLSANLAPNASQGLLEAMADPSQLASYVTKTDFPGIDALPCVLLADSPDLADMLGSPQMEQLLAAARENYDYILIEIPPIMSGVDLKMIEHFIDKFIFVIEWGQTKRRLVREALAEAEIIRDRLMCVVLNKADSRALRKIEAYKGARLRQRYGT